MIKINPVTIVHAGYVVGQKLEIMKDGVLVGQAVKSMGKWDCFTSAGKYVGTYSNRTNIKNTFESLKSVSAL